MYKVVISDLDGTLLNNQHHVSPHTRKILKKLVAEGTKFVVATGRHHIDVKAIRDALGLDIYLVTANGAVVTDKQDAIIFNRTLPTDIAQELSELPLPDPDIAVNIYTPEAWFTNKDMPEYLEYHKDTGFCYTKTDLVTLDKSSINKFFFIAEHEPLLELENTLLERYAGQLSIAFSQPDCLEVMALGVNKGAAIASILTQHDIPLSAAIAFGDGMNDYEMLSMVGHGVVMGNAHDRLKMALPELPRAGINDEDGVAEYLQQLLLTE
ncbi:Cof-type HAD-IIB family hydrolase [Tolumonas lignilytica]|uniref:Cof-type HAD-IIB family hydrolase n=1 Tax=Tolumonas lignilytica TaxID=1283284 RepID=UPI0004645D64|nr:Cof-type HAD-IIB family hydrolase [Tolumonas lignilytica]